MLTPLSTVWCAISTIRSEFKLKESFDSANHSWEGGGQCSHMCGANKHILQLMQCSDFCFHTSRKSSNRWAYFCVFNYMKFSYISENIAHMNSTVLRACWEFRYLQSDLTHIFRPKTSWNPWCIPFLWGSSIMGLLQQQCFLCSAIHCTIFFRNFHKWIGKEHFLQWNTSVRIHHSVFATASQCLPPKRAAIFFL